MYIYIYILLCSAAARDPWMFKRSHFVVGLGIPQKQFVNVWALLQVPCSGHCSFFCYWECTKMHHYKTKNHPRGDVVPGVSTTNTTLPKIMFLWPGHTHRPCGFLTAEQSQEFVVVFSNQSSKDCFVVRRWRQLRDYRNAIRRSDARAGVMGQVGWRAPAIEMGRVMSTGRCPTALASGQQLLTVT